MPRAKMKKASRVKTTARKMKRTRAKLSVIVSAGTQRAQGRYEGARGKVAAERQRMRAAQSDARKVAGKGRGTRPANPRAAERAKEAVNKSRARLAELRAVAGGVKRELVAAQRDDKLRAKANSVRDKAAAANAAGTAKVAAKVDKSVAKFRALRLKQLGSAEARRAKRRDRAAESKAKSIERRIGGGGRRGRKKAAA